MKVVLIGVGVFIEPAAMISKPMEDVKAPEKEKATLECEVSRTNAEVKWFKVRKHIPVNHGTVVMKSEKVFNVSNFICIIVYTIKSFLLKYHCFLG